jgi:hypothetical protein
MDARREAALAKIAFLRLASAMGTRLACALLMVAPVACASAPPPPVVDVATMVATLDPGQSRASFSGCLAAPGRKQESKRSVVDFPPDEIRTRVVAGGAVVTHVLTHPCCVEASVNLTTRGGVATVHERLGGEPCPCTCQSTIDTAIGLPVGMWTVRVEVEEPFQAARTAGERRVKILEPRAELPH